MKSNETLQLERQNDNDIIKLQTQFSILKKMVENFGISSEYYVKNFAELFAKLWDEGVEKNEIENIFNSMLLSKIAIESSKMKVWKILWRN